MEVNVQQSEVDTTSFYGSADMEILRVKDVVEQDLRLSKGPRRRNRDASIFDESGDLNNEVGEGATLLLFRIGCSDACVVDITFHQGDNVPSPVTTSESISEAIVHGIQSFEDKFERVFPLPDGIEELDRENAKRALSSQLSGIGFFYGAPEIHDSMEVNPDNASPPTNPAPIALFTGTPSRTSFPRGFLWDEGFHLLQLATWDPSMSMYIVAHWLNAMYVNTSPSSASCKGGWIPREMVLGAEGRTRVPSEFIPQHVDIANPPTLLLAVEKLAEVAKHKAVLSCSADTPETCDIKGDSNFGATQFNEFVEKFAPGLDRWVQWFLQSQVGPDKAPGSFRWRGRPTTHSKLLTNTLASGLDDYPRAAFPTAEEYHVDLLAWMIRSSQVNPKPSVLPYEPIA